VGPGRLSHVWISYDPSDLPSLAGPFLKLR
jgi:hypothetical protein